MDTRIKEREREGVFLINAHRIVLQLHFDAGSVLVDMPHIPRIPIDSGNNTLRKFIYKLTDSELSHMSLHHCCNDITYILCRPLLRIRTAP